jgi:hypothetical protein
VISGIQQSGTRPDDRRTAGGRVLPGIGAAFEVEDEIRWSASE